MDDLLQIQIQESCKLALPNGLKELMSDISREVLRSLPPNLYDFIAKYLAALLVTRENLSIAGRVCQNVCDPSCQLDLEDELKKIFLDKEDAVKAKEVIEGFFAAGKVDESSLMVKLLKMFSITQEQLEQVQQAVRNAFLQHHLNKTDNTIRQMPSDIDDISHAAIHTLTLYAGIGPSQEDYNQKAKRIQAAYRAYGVRRLCSSKPDLEKKEPQHIRFSTETFEPDLSSETLETDSSKIEECGSKVHKTQSQIELYEDIYHETKLTPISEKNLPEKIQSFVNYEGVKEKRITSLTDEINTKNDADEYSYSERERKLSTISEVHFKEPLIYEKLYEETIEDNAHDEFGSINEEAIIFFDPNKIVDEKTQIVKEHPAIVDIVSDDSVEENVVEDNEEFAMVIVGN